MNSKEIHVPEGAEAVLSQTCTVDVFIWKCLLDRAVCVCAQFVWLLLYGENLFCAQRGSLPTSLGLLPELF